jgi:hypothetical protein
MKTKVTVDEWVAMFEAIGLATDKMTQWHRVFETRHPEGHQSFLEWLGLPAEKVAEIRQKSR